VVVGRRELQDIDDGMDDGCWRTRRADSHKKPKREQTSMRKNRRGNWEQAHEGTSKIEPSRSSSSVSQL
jgi:hypothetical protein